MADFDKSKRYMDKHGGVWYWSGLTRGCDLRSVTSLIEEPPADAGPYVEVA